jgi:hypothetical protein
VYAYWDGANVRLELAVTPATPTLANQDGVQVKAGDATRRYVGVLGTTAFGTFEDSRKNRLVWNRNNQVPRPINGVDLSDWYYTGNQSTWRETHGSSASRLKVASGILNGADGVAGTYVSVQAVGMCLLNNPTNAGSPYVATGIGIDSSTTNSAQIVELAATTIGVYAHTSASYEGYLAAGIHSLYWLEMGQTGYTFYCIGYSYSPPFGQLGMNGSVLM